MRKPYALLIVLCFLIFCSCSGLLHSAKVGDLQGVKESLAKGQSIDHKNESGRTALIIASYSKHPDVVEYLCQKGANVNAQDMNGCTALLHAAYYNAVEVARVLLKYGADKTIRDRYGNTPLDYAKKYEYAEMQALLEGK